MVALSPCFRREAVSYGKDTLGLLPRPRILEKEQVIKQKMTYHC
jgi:seryl-tRNA synthetase